MVLMLECPLRAMSTSRLSRSGVWTGGPSHQLRQELGHGAKVRDVIGLGQAQGRRRHLGKRRVAGVLHHRQPAARLERLQAGRAVAHGAGQHHADGAMAAADRGRAKQRIDRRARVVLPRAMP
jgi:hypothetical protein